jgi:hypothetical protein
MSNQIRKELQANTVRNLNACRARFLAPPSPVKTTDRSAVSASLPLERLIQIGPALSWAEQRRVLGFTE